MNPLLSSTVEAFGWALLHCLWQGAAVALALAVFLRAAKNSRAALRYSASTAALAVFVAGFGATLVLSWPAANVPAGAVPPAATADSNALPASRSGTGEMPTKITAAPPLATSAKPTNPPTTLAHASSSVAPATPAAAAAATTSWSERLRSQLPWAVAVWAIGVLFFSVRFLVAWVGVRRLVTRAVPVLDPAWNGRFSKLAEALRLSRPVRFLVSAALTAPAVIGWLKPVVLVPAGIFTGLTAAQLEAILAHELAHIRRHDYLVNLLQNFVETLFFFHPAAWWISRQMRDEREHCCDALAAELSGGALSYAKALAALEETRGAAPALALAATGGSLLARIRRLLGVPEQKSAAWPLGVLMIGLAAFLFTVAMVKEARAEDGPVLASEANDGTYHSYCVHQNGEVQFVLLSKHEFTLAKEAGPERGRLSFKKGKDSIKFAPAPDDAKVLVLSLPGNLVLQYDLAQSRVFLIDYDRHFFSPIIRQIPVKLEPVTSPESLQKESLKVAAWLAAATEEQLWEFTRVKVPEGNYKGGANIDSADPAIIWGEPNEVGLRLGIGGLTQNQEIAAGHTLPIAQYIRNDGPKAVRLSPTGPFNEGVVGEMESKDGTKIALKSGYPWPMFFIYTKLEPGQFAKLQSGGVQTILKNRDGSPATAQQAYTSGFLLSPGDYTLRLSHRVGQFLGKPMNANEGDPRLAPGLGEWRGVLKAVPIALRISGPAADTARPGTAIELLKTHRIQFQKGQIVLSHRRPGLTGTGTWTVDANGNWPAAGSTWKIADPSGDYLAGWDEGSTRLWYVDSTGIQRLDIAEKLVDAGHWTMEQADGDLANMPDAVRKALKLPAKKVPAPGGAGWRVRGFSLEGAPKIAGAARPEPPSRNPEHPDVFEPDPKTSGKTRLKADFFALRLFTKGEIFDDDPEGNGWIPPVEVAPTLYASKSRRLFYIAAHGAAYGPFTGDAGEELGLRQMLRDKLAESWNREGLALLEKIINDGPASLRNLACELLSELPAPKNPFDYDGVFGAAIGYSVESDSGMPFAANSGVNHLHQLVHAARAKWEAKRVELPDSAYKPGEKIGAENPDIVWGEPDKSGLRFGVLGLSGAPKVAIGAHLPVQFFIRNDGPVAVKLSPAHSLKKSLGLRLEDAAGNKYEAGYKFDDGLSNFNHCRLEPGHLMKIGSPEIDFFATKEDIAKSAHRKGFEHSPRVAAPPRQYRVHLDYRVGSAEATLLAVSATGPEKLEWTGLLGMKPIELTVVAP